MLVCYVFFQDSEHEDLRAWVCNIFMYASVSTACIMYLQMQNVGTIICGLSPPIIVPKCASVCGCWALKIRNSVEIKFCLKVHYILTRIRR